MKDQAATQEVMKEKQQIKIIQSEFHIMEERIITP